MDQIDVPAIAAREAALAAREAASASAAATNELKNIVSKATEGINLLNKDFQYMKINITEIKLMLDQKYVSKEVFEPLNQNYVSKEVFEPVKKLVYGLVALILTAVAVSLIGLVLIK